MRIGFVTGEYPPMEGGVGAFTRILGQTLAGMRHDVYVFSSTWAKTPFPGITLHSEARRWGLGSLSAINRWAKREKLDVVNLQFQTAAFNMSPFVHFLPRFVDVPVVTTFHDLRYPYLFPKAGPLREWIVMRLARSSAGVIVTNHEDLTRVDHLPCATLIPIGSNILAPLPAGFDAVRWRERVGVQEGDFLLAHFGFLNRSKGIETLLESVAMLRNQGTRIRLLMIGGRTGTSDTTNVDYANFAETRVAELGLSEHTYWTGYVDDEAVSAFLASADAVALPFLDGASFRRGTLMAAIHHGCAIVTTTPQVPVPVFVDGENMSLVPPGDAASLAGAIRELCCSPVLRQRLRAGTNALDRNFDWTRIAQDTLTFFRQITGERP